jgi:hypothetical protein
MGNDDDGSSQAVRLKEWDLQSLEGPGCSLKEFDSQSSHLWNGNNSSTNFAFYISENKSAWQIVFSISCARGEND